MGGSYLVSHDHFVLEVLHKCCISGAPVHRSRHLLLKQRSHPLIAVWCSSAVHPNGFYFPLSSPFTPIYILASVRFYRYTTPPNLHLHLKIRFWSYRQSTQRSMSLFCFRRTNSIPYVPLSTGPSSEPLKRSFRRRYLFLAISLCILLTSLALNVTLVIKAHHTYVNPLDNYQTLYVILRLYFDSALTV